MSLSTTQTFEKILDDITGEVINYQSVVIENGIKITSTFDLEFSVISTSKTVVFTDLKNISEMSVVFQEAWNKADGGSLYNIDVLKFSERENGSILVVSEGSDEIFGRINNWSHEDTWTDWNDREVTNTSYSYNFHDGDWNHFGSSGGYTREVSFEVDDVRWDGEIVTNAFTVEDEKGSDANYRVQLPEEGESTDAWAALDPGADLLSKLNLSWSEITEVNVGSNTWSQSDTNGATRDEASTSSDSRIELYSDNGNGGTDYVGRLEYRSDGFIEIYDESWNMVSRTVDLSNPDNLLTWDDLTNPASEDYVSGLSDAWSEVGNYLPGALRDDDTTADDERDALVFTQNQWGDLNAFSATGELLARIDSWDHSGYWQSNMYDESAGTYIEGLEYNTGTSFNFNDDDWNQLARSNSEKRYFLSDANVEEFYAGEPPADFSEITTLDHVSLRWTNEGSGFTAQKSDLASVWDGLIKNTYGIPSAADGVEGILDWADVTSVFVETNTWTDYDLAGNETHTDGEDRVQYFGEGYWADNEFVLLSEHNEDLNGPLSDYHVYDNMLGVVDTRDGFIVVRDGNWNELGRFVDLENAIGFDEFAVDYDGLASAWDAVSAYLPTDWADRDELQFATDSGNNILVVEEDGTLLGRINNWSNTETSSETVRENISFNFRPANEDRGDINYNQYVKSENGIISYSDTDIRTSAPLGELSAETLSAIKPIENQAGITIDGIDSVYIQDSTEVRFDDAGGIISTSIGFETYYYNEDFGYIGYQENYSGSINLYDAYGELLVGEFNGALVPADFLGTNTNQILENWLSVYEEMLNEEFETTASWSLMQLEGQTTIALVIDDEQVVAVGSPDISMSSDGLINWHIDFDGAAISGWNDASDGEASVSNYGVKSEIFYESDDPEFGEIMTIFAPSGDVDVSETVWENFVSDDIGEIRFETWTNYEEGGVDNQYTRATFIPKFSSSSDLDWDNSLSVKLEKDLFTLEDNQYDEVGVYWLNSNIATIDEVNFLGENTSDILGNWLSVFETTLEQHLGKTGDFGFKQTINGDLVLTLDGEMVSVGEIRIDEEPNSNNELYWRIEFDALEFQIAGWNEPMAGFPGEYELETNGVKLVRDYYSDDENFANMVQAYAPASSINLSGTPAEAFSFSDVAMISHGIWYNDFHGVGVYKYRTDTEFVPFDENGGDDWDSKITVQTEEGITQLKDANWDDIGDPWISILTRDDTVSYDDYSLHQNTVESLYGNESWFSDAGYELINGEVLLLDFNKDGLGDVFLTSAANGGNWQELLSVETLDQVGGIFAGPDYDFARLPSDYEKVEDWIESFQLSLANLESDNAVEILLQLKDLFSKDLSVQVQTYQTTIVDGEWDKAVGLRFMEGEKTEGSFWIAKLVDETYSVSVNSPEITEIVMSVDESLYVENVSLLHEMIEINRSQESVVIDLENTGSLQFNLDIDLSSPVSFDNFESDILAANMSLGTFFDNDFISALTNLYDAPLEASEMEFEEGTTYVEVASDGNFEHYFKFNNAVTVAEVNAALINPEANANTIMSFFGVESIEINNDRTALSFEIEDNGIKLTNSSIANTQETSLSFEGDGLPSIDGLYSVIAMANQLVTNNSDTENDTFSELVQDTAMGMGFDRFTVKSGDETVLDILASDQETENSSFDMIFGNSVVNYENAYSNISDLLTSMAELDFFDPFLIAEMSATENNSSDSLELYAEHDDQELLELVIQGVEQFESFDFSSLLNETNVSETTTGIIFTNEQSQNVIEVTMNENLTIDDVYEFFETDIF